jgi:hypothetical protein
LADTSKKLRDREEILGEDLHTLLRVIQTLFDDLNFNYLENDKILQEEVSGLIKSLYDPEVEKRGIAIGIAEGIAKGEHRKAIEIAISLLDVLPIETIAIKTGLSINAIEELKKQL